MEITNFITLLKEFGPELVILGLAVWGIYKLIELLLEQIGKKDGKIEKAETKKDAAYDKLTEYLMNALDERDVKKQKYHDEAAEYRKKVIRKCNEYAKEMMDESGADQVAIYDYCNGTQSLAGIPFLHFRVIAEKENKILRRAIYSEKLDINTLGTFLLDLEKEHMITIKNVKRIESNYPELSQFMQILKRSKGIYANIVGTRSSLGFVAMTFNSNKKVDYDKMERLLQRYTQKISNLLDYPNIIS